MLLEGGFVAPEGLLKEADGYLQEVGREFAELVLEEMLLEPDSGLSSDPVS